LGIALGNVGHTAEALEVLGDAIARESQNELLLYERAQIETHSGDVASAEADLRKSLTLRPDYADALNNLGSLLAQSGDTGGAESSFREALVVNPYDGGTRGNLGRLLTAKRSLLEAEFQFQRSIELSPSDAETRLDYAIALLEGDHAAKAETQIRAALKIDPESPRALDLMGQLALARRQPADARADFEAALKNDANFGPAQLDLAETLLESGDMKSAIPWLERAAQSDSPVVAQRARELARQIHPPK
jgi:FimV-like protein